jgi:GYF domain 2
MKYYIQRQLNEYGPYTLADLQRYVAQESIQLTDLTRSEGMTDWVPVSQVIGNIPIPVPGPAGQAIGTAPSGGASGTVYGGPSPAYGVQAVPAFANSPVPTDFHWALVLLITVFTCGLFGWAWLFVEAAYVRKLRPSSHGLLFSILGFSIWFVGACINGYNRATYGTRSTNLWFSIIGFALVIVALFQMKSDLEDYYNTEEPIKLQLNGVMTFFFGTLYFQHHLSRIAQWKRSGYLQPQGS